jgi:hypothetical protein
LGAYLAAADEAQQLKERREAVAAGFAAVEARDAGSPGAPETGQAWFGDAASQQQWPADAQGAATGGWQLPGDPYAAAAAQGQQPSYGEVYGGGYDPGYPEQAVYPADPYGAQGAGYPPQPGYAPQTGYSSASYGYPQPEARSEALDETSFFDTSVIDVARLRELGGGR